MTGFYFCGFMEGFCSTFCNIMYTFTNPGVQVPLGGYDPADCHSYDYLYASLCYLFPDENQTAGAVLQFAF